MTNKNSKRSTRVTTPPLESWVDERLTTDAAARPIGTVVSEDIESWTRLRSALGLGNLGITKKELEAIEARENAATPGPWVEKRLTINAPARGLGATASEGKDLRFYACDASDDEVKPEADLEFICGARLDIPALVAEVRRLQAQRCVMVTIVG
jgi:hypothetical protein